MLKLALRFFEGGPSRRLVNASHSSFCISAPQFELKLDIEFHGCVYRERESEW
jgi:hypothetical protein